MKVLYTCVEDSDDVGAWSGLVYFIRRALESAGFEVEPFHDLSFKIHAIERLLDYSHNYVLGKIHYLTLESAVLRNLAKQVERKFESGHYDLVFSPSTGVPVTAYIRPGIPVFTYGDSTKSTWIKSYFGQDCVSRRTWANAKQVDEAILRSHHGIFFASDWAARDAFSRYGSPFLPVHVVPFGANIATPRSEDEIREHVRLRNGNVCNLLFMGVEWERKGGRLVYEVALRLHQRGVPIRLTIAGVSPPRDVLESPFVRYLGFFDKSKSNQLNRYENAFLNADFFIMLSRAEIYGLVFCEASAFGVPSIAPAIGGIPTIVRSGRNGALFKSQPDLDDVCRYIESTFINRKSYQNLAMSSYREFQDRLNWKVVGQTILNLVSDHMGRMRVMR